MMWLLECDTETSRPRARTRVVEVIDAAGCYTGQLRVNFGIVTGIRSPKSEVVARQIDTGTARYVGEAWRVKGVAESKVREAGEGSVFDPARRKNSRLGDFLWDVERPPPGGFCL